MLFIYGFPGNVARLTLYATSEATSGGWSLPGVLGYNVAHEESSSMTGNSVVRARIDERTKREAAAALKKIGLTVSDAFRLLLVRVAAEKALPFEPLNPNAETVAAMKAARRGELVKAGKPDKLLRSLKSGD
jgi:DNA-damage-inducible protein J